MGEHMSPAQARELAEELRNYREILGVPAYELAHRLGWSASKLSRVENGLAPISEVDVVRYGAHCGISAEGIEALLDLCRDTGAAGYWLSKWSSTLVFAENTAAFSASYDPLVVPGMLQTEEYAAALIGPDKPGWVQVRIERQRLLNKRPFEFFIHEQALRLPVGGDRVMKQLAKFYKKLARLSEAALGARESRERLAEMASEVDRPEDSPDDPDDVAEEQLQLRT